jgi:pimeloyl-ACP methyl ester carboxylesterase
VSSWSDEERKTMDIILVPGLWLDGSSWDEVVPRIEAAGHQAHPITLPGMESRDTDRSSVSRSDCVGAIIQVIDSTAGPVTVVGHSVGAGLVHAAVDARPERVARAIYIGGFPSGPGESDDFPSTDGEIPLFEWSDFDEADLVDLDEAGRARFRARAIPSPERMVSDPQVLNDERRYEVPVTMICPEFTAEMLQGWIEQGMEPVMELSRIGDVTYVDLPTGHWPQFTRPAELAEAIIEAVDQGN